MKTDLSGVVIRQVQESDLKALEWDGQFKHFRRVYQHAFKESQNGDRILLVADLAGELIGQIFIHLRPVNLGTDPSIPTGYFHSFRVRSPYRGMGLGSQLLSRAEQVLLDGGYRLAIIAVSKTNDRALSFYQKSGYEIYRQDSGQWSYYDHKGRLQEVIEPSYLLKKSLDSN